MATTTSAEQSFIMVKPDGVQRGLVGEIIKRFEQKVSFFARFCDTFLLLVYAWVSSIFGTGLSTCCLEDVATRP